MFDSSRGRARERGRHDPKRIYAELQLGQSSATFVLSGSPFIFRLCLGCVLFPLVFTLLSAPQMFPLFVCFLSFVSFLFFFNL